MGIDRLSSSSGKSSVHSGHNNAAMVNAAASRTPRFGARNHYHHHHHQHNQQQQQQQLAHIATANVSNASATAINRKLELEFINKLDKRPSHDDLSTRRRLRSERSHHHAGVRGFSSSADDSSNNELPANADDFNDHHRYNNDDVDDVADDGAVDDYANDSIVEREVAELLQLCRTRLEDTMALRVRSHLLRPADYVSGILLISGLCGSTTAASRCWAAGALLAACVHRLTIVLGQRRRRRRRRQRSAFRGLTTATVSPGAAVVDAASDCLPLAVLVMLLFGLSAFVVWCVAVVA